MVKRNRDPNRKSSRHFNLEKPTSKKFNLEKPIGKEFDLEKDVDEGQIQNIAVAPKDGVAAMQEKDSSSAVGTAATMAAATAAVATGASPFSDGKATDASPALDSNLETTTDSASIVEDSVDKRAINQQSSAQQTDVEYTPKGSDSISYPNGGDTEVKKTGKGKWLAAAAVVALLGGGGYYLLHGGQSHGDSGVDETIIAMNNEEEQPASDMTNEYENVSTETGSEKVDKTDVGTTTDDNSSSSRVDEPNSKISDNVSANKEQYSPVKSSTNSVDQGGKTGGVQANKQDGSLRVPVPNSSTSGTESSRNLSNGASRSTNSDAQSSKQNPSSVSRTATSGGSSGAKEVSPSTSTTNQSQRPVTSTREPSSSVQKNVSSKSVSTSGVAKNSRGQKVVATIDPASLEHMSSAELEDFARRAIRGEFGNNPERSKILGKAYRKIQNRVNKLMRKNNSR